MVTDTGRAATQARVELGYADGERVFQAASGVIPEFPDLCSAIFHVPEIKAQELRVWLHRVTAEGQPEHLPALVKVSLGKDIWEYHIDGTGKQFVFPLKDFVKKEHQESTSEASQLEIEVQLTARTT